MKMLLAVLLSVTVLGRFGGPGTGGVKTETFGGRRYLVSEKLQMKLVKGATILDVYNESSPTEGLFLSMGKQIPSEVKDIRIDTEKHLRANWDKPLFNKEFDSGTLGPFEWRSFGKNRLYGRWGKSGGMVHGEGYLLVKRRRMHIMLSWRKSELGTEKSLQSDLVEVPSSIH